VSLLYFIARIFSLYLVWNDRPVSSMYCRGQSMHANLYALLLSYLLLLCCFGCRCFCMVLIVLKATLVSLPLNILQLTY
jgi:hypothetical protein